MLKPYFHADIIEAGCDEAGRGCYAGPVFAAAVILPKNFYHPLLNDSKQVAEKDRFLLKEIIEKEAISFAVANVSEVEIDNINILNASIKAMHLALQKLTVKPDHILVDGNRFKPFEFIPHSCIIQGDSKYASIAAASILAKTNRDVYMLSLAEKYPQYLWHKNKGYGTAEHRKAIAKFGLCEHHRKSFKI
ncbi:MAG: ribonuclease HII [Chitinophagaceae bacterium]